MSEYENSPHEDIMHETKKSQPSSWAEQRENAWRTAQQERHEKLLAAKQAFIPASESSPQHSTSVAEIQEQRESINPQQHEALNAMSKIGERLRQQLAVIPTSDPRHAMYEGRLKKISSCMQEAEQGNWSLIADVYARGIKSKYFPGLLSGQIKPGSVAMGKISQSVDDLGVIYPEAKTQLLAELKDAIDQKHDKPLRDYGRRSSFDDGWDLNGNGLDDIADWGTWGGIF